MAATAQPQRAKPAAQPRKRSVTPTIKPNYLKNVQSKIKQQVQQDKATFFNQDL
jgi:hypothetical protein